MRAAMLLGQAAVRSGFARGDGRGSPLGSAKVANGELAPTRAVAAKSAEPQQLLENRTKQDELVANDKKQVNEAIEQPGARGKGDVRGTWKRSLVTRWRRSMVQTQAKDFEIGKRKGSRSDNLVD